MKRYLTQEEFNGLRQRLAAGQASIGISRRISRQFFTRVSNASIVETTGRSLLGQKLIVWTGVILAQALLVASMAAVVGYFGWFAAVGAPLVGIFWTIIAGLTGDKGPWYYGVAGLIAGLALAAILEEAFAVPLLLFTVSLVVHRLTYHLAGFWLSSLIAQSWGAYDMLVDHIDIEDEVLARAEVEPARA